MLSHFPEMKKKAILLIALMAIAMLGLYSGIVLLTATSFVSAWLILPLFLIPVFGNLIFNKFEADAMLTIVDMVHLYENDCKPQEFIDAIDPILDTFRPRFDINETWTLSAYARALVEVGEEEKARIFLDTFQEHVDTSEHPEEKGPLMINYEPLVLMLDGEEAALDLLNVAEKAIIDIPEIRKQSGKVNHFTSPELREDLLRSPDMQARLLYIEVEKRFLQASLQKDVKALEHEKSIICSDDGSSSALKARYIFALAEAHLANGDTANARKAFQETIHVARGLRCAEKSKQILATIV